MKHSTPWYNLFSTELKYNVSVKSQNITYKVALGYALFCSVMAALFMFLTLPFNNSFYVIVSATAAFIISFIWFIKQPTFILKKSFVLSEKGVISFSSDEKWQITSPTFNMLFAYLITLQRVDYKGIDSLLATPTLAFRKQANMRLVIFRSQLSHTNFCRLSRISQRIKNS